MPSNVVLSVIRPIDIASATPSSVLYDELLFAGKPDLQPYGLKPFPLFYEGELMPPGYTIDTPPNEARVRQAAQSLVASGYPVNEAVALDVELWEWSTKYTTEAIATESMNKLALIIDWFKDEAPMYTKVGYYSVGPNREYGPSFNQPPGSYAEWQASNTFLAPIISHQLALYPSIYTFYNEPSNWVLYANSNMDEAARIAPGKPIYPFIWPRYHEGGVLGQNNVYIDYDFWMLHLETLAAHPATTGIVFWGGVRHPYPAEGFEPWDPTWPWWQATQDFIASSGVYAARTAKKVV